MTDRLRAKLESAFSPLALDIEDAESAVHMVFGPCLNVRPTRWRALVNMAFNRGQNNMQHSTTITPAIKAALDGGDWSAVTAAIASSPWAKQVGARALRIAYTLEHDEVMP